MARFSRSDYGRNPHAGAARNVANGFVGVWPGGVPSSHLGMVNAAGVSFPMQRRLVPLVETLLTATEQMGYDVKRGQTWGYANRPIGGTRFPSNHSRGKAVDINSITNPFGRTFVSDMPPAVVHMWEACGWYWGGRYERTPDAMHFEYLGRPEDVDKHLTRARGYLRGAKPAPSTDRPSTATQWGKPYTGRPGGRIVDLYDRGTDVALLQRFLGVKPADGAYGGSTIAAVKRYQKMLDLPADGVVGPKTWAPILRALGLTAEGR